MKRRRAAGGGRRAAGGGRRATGMTAPRKGGVWIPFDREFACNHDRFNAAVESMASALAAFLSIRCKVFLRRGRMITDMYNQEWTMTGADGIISPCMVGVCHACRREPSIAGRIICAKCQNQPFVMTQGATLMQLMYSGSHPDLRLTAAKFNTINILRSRWVFSYDCMHLCHGFEQTALAVLDDALSGASDGNFRFDKNWTAPDGPYVASVPYPRSSSTRKRSPGRVGAVGDRLRNHVKGLVANWLRQIDEINAVRFDPVAMSTGVEQASASVEEHIEYFATLIANMVTHMEREEAPASSKLNSATCGQQSETQFWRLRTIAQEEAQADVCAMCDVLLLISSDVGRDEKRQLMSNPKRKVAAIGILEDMPPELRARTPSLHDVFDVAGFCEMLTRTYSSLDAHLDAMDRTLSRVFNPCVVIELLKSAIEDTQTWRREWQERQTYFLPVVCLADSKEASLRLPSPPWARSTKGWAYRKGTPWMRKRRRVGLDPRGVRIVLLSSMLQEMLASVDSPFQAGVLAAEHVIQIAGEEYNRASAACIALREELRPLYAGVEYAQARLTVLEGHSNHIEDDLQRALCPLSWYSLRDMVTCFSKESPHYILTASMLSARVRELMVTKPAERYGDFVHAALDMFLPLVGSLRARVCTSAALRPSACMHPLGDLLRTLRAVREWNVDEQPHLYLSLAEVKTAPPQLLRMLQELAKQKGAVWFKREPGRDVRRFQLYGPALRPVLGALDVAVVRGS
jgi:hypothetical protein